MSRADAFLELRTAAGSTLKVTGLSENDEREAAVLIAEIVNRDEQMHDDGGDDA
jgi:hypothetical protein